jgi:hypothetical protein
MAPAAMATAAASPSDAPIIDFKDLMSLASQLFRGDTFACFMTAPYLGCGYASVQATQWPGFTSRNSGILLLQLSTAKEHLGWNTQPLGGFMGLGTSPLTVWCSRLASISGSGTGTAASSALV